MLFVLGPLCAWSAVYVTVLGVFGVRVLCVLDVLSAYAIFSSCDTGTIPVCP